MRSKDIEAIGDELIAAMRRIVAPIVERLAVLEAARGEQQVQLAATVAKFDVSHGGLLRLEDQLRALVDRVSQIPAGQRGEKGEKGDAGQPGPAGLPGERGERGEKGADGANGKDGKDGMNGANGADGRDGEHGPQGERGEKGEPGPAGAAGPQGERGEKGADGAHGRDGRDGVDGKSVTLEDVQPIIEVAVKAAEVQLEQRAAYLIDKAVARIPAPKDGKDGRDAFDLDDIVIEHDGERTLTVGFRRGNEEVVRQFRTPGQIDRGVYGIGSTYEKGDGVTYGGDYWIAVRDVQTGEKPGSSDAWRLAVRKGRDGRRGE